MATQDLYNLSPAIRLMLMGLVVALGPLAWVWLRNRKAALNQRLRLLTLLTLFLTFDLVLFGAFTRLTDSGLGCPDWPGCYGHASPVGAQLQIDAAQSALPSGPVTHPKAWIEMIHRYLATGVGVLIVVLAVVSWLERRGARRGGTRSDKRGSLFSAGPPQGKDDPLEGQRSTHSDKRGGNLSPWWPTLTLVWVCLQGAFGALTVTMKLFPAIVTMHLLGGLILLALLKAQAVRYAQAQGGQGPVALPSGVRVFIGLGFCLLWLQIALGGWVSTNYAVLACTDFPGCQNSLWPAMDFSQGFTLWRELGAGPNGENISFQALTAIHYVHRLGAYVLLAVLLALAARLYRVPALRTHAQWLAGLILLQAATGLGNVVLGWPLLAAVSHTGGAAALVLVLTGIVFSSRQALAALPEPKLNASTLSA